MTQSNLLTQTASPVTLRVPDFKRVTITLVGCGGTGSHIASGLVSIAQALRDRSIAVDMTFIDPDRVEQKNVGRQLFSSGDVGEAKAEVLAGRLNAAFGERIMSTAHGVEALDILPAPQPSPTSRLAALGATLNLVIGAVDNPAARAIIADVVKSSDGALWWLDCGNENHSGQVLLGNTATNAALRGAIALGMVDRLPAPSVLYPDLVKTPKAKKTKRGSSCAELTASGEQSLMINRLMAAYALSMLTDFIVTRDLRYFGVALDAQWGGLRTYVIDAPTIAEACGLTVSDITMKTKASKK